MLGMADRGGDDLRGDAAGAEALDDLGEHLAGVDRDVVEAAHEAGDVGGAGAGGQQRLVGREDERHVDRDAVGRELVGRRQPLLAERDLHRDVLVQLAQRPALGDHPGGVLGDDLGRDGSADQLADALDDVARVAVLLRQERRVGGRTGEDAPAGDLLDLGDRSGVDEEPHCAQLRSAPRSLSRRDRCPRPQRRRPTGRPPRRSACASSRAPRPSPQRRGAPTRRCEAAAPRAGQGGCGAAARRPPSGPARGEPRRPPRRAGRAARRRSGSPAPGARRRSEGRAGRRARSGTRAARGSPRGGRPR